MKHCLLSLLLISSLFTSIQSMEQGWPPVQKPTEGLSDFKKLPMDVKLYLISKILEGSSIITVLKEFKALKDVDKEFNKIIRELPERAKNWLVYKPFFEFIEVVKSNNIFTILDFLKREPNRKLLYYHDLAHFIHSKLYYHPFEDPEVKIFYLPIDAIQAGLNLCNPSSFEAFKNSVKDIQEELERVLVLIDPNVKRTLELLFIEVDPNLSIDEIPPVRFIIDHFVNSRLIYTYLKLFVDKKAEIHLGDLSEAILSSNLDVVGLLLKNGANPNDFVDEDNIADKNSPLEIAIDTENTPMLKLLLSYGAKTNIVLANGLIPLINAAYFKNKEMINWLLKFGADTSDLESELDYVESLAIEGKITREQADKWLEAYKFMIKAVNEYKLKAAQEESDEILESMKNLFIK